MKKIATALFMVTIFMMGSITTSFAQAKEKKTIEEKSVKNANTRGADANIKVPKPTQDQAVPKSRGPSYPGYCDVVICNNTGYTIDIYVDYAYRGTIGAWEEKVTWAIPGPTRLYAKSIGGTVYWGPREVDCNYMYTWRLND
jgi:hypothetical protein